jgi:hypothetical protein
MAMRMDDLRLLYINIRRNLDGSHPNAGKSASHSPRLSRMEERNEARNFGAATEKEIKVQHHSIMERRTSKWSSAPLSASERHRFVTLGNSPSELWAQNGELEKGSRLEQV